MTETKFTIAPWKKTKTASDLPKIVDKNGFAICHGKDYGKQADANFDLIASAPEMYEWLSKLSERLEYVIFELGNQYVEVKFSEKEVRVILDILAKARGENTNQPLGTNTN